MPGDVAQQRAEHGDDLAAEGLARQRRRRDCRRGAAFAGSELEPAQLGQRHVEVFQAGPRHRPLRRHMPETPVQQVEHGPLLGLVGRQRGMPALPADRDLRVAIVGPQQPRHPEPGPGPDQPLGRAGHRLAAADLAHRLRSQHRQRQRQRGEVVDHQDPLRAQRRLQRPRGEAPVVVGHADMVAGDGGGDADRAAAWPGQALAMQVIEDRVRERVEVAAHVARHVLQRLRRTALAGEAHMRRAHVRQQPHWRRSALTHAFCSFTDASVPRRGRSRARPVRESLGCCHSPSRPRAGRCRRARGSVPGAQRPALKAAIASRYQWALSLARRCWVA